MSEREPGAVKHTFYKLKSNSCVIYGMLHKQKGQKGVRLKREIGRNIA